MTSGNLHDSKVAIRVLKKGKSFISRHFTTAILDVGYDYVSTYCQTYHQSMRVIITDNVRCEGEFIRFDKHFRPISVRDHSYRYDSFDMKYHTLKFIQSKECETCPLQDDSPCQRVFKVKCEQISANIHIYPVVLHFGRIYIKNEHLWNV